MRASRPLAGALVLVVAGSFLTACGSGGHEASAPPKASPSTSASSPTTTTTNGSLRVAVYGDPLRIRTYQKIVRAFERRDPGVHVTLLRYDDAGAAARAELATLQEEQPLRSASPSGAATSSPSGSASPSAGRTSHGSANGQPQPVRGPDVFLADYRYFADLVDTGGLEPVDALLEERGLQFGDGYQRDALTAFSADSHLLCMPAEVSPLVVYINKRLFHRARFGPEQLKLPDEKTTTWGWQSFLQAARGMAQVDGSGPVKGAFVPLDTETLTTLIRSAGGDVVDDVFAPTTLALESGPGLQAIGDLVTLGRDDILTPSDDSMTPGQAADLFARGRLGMLVGTRNDLPRLRQEKGLRFDVLPMPSLSAPTSVATMNGYCIDNSSQRVGLAADFVAFAVGRTASRIAARSGAIVPSSLATVSRPAFLQPGQQPKSGYVYGTAIRRSDPMPYSPVWADVSDDVDRFLRVLVKRPGVDLAATMPKRAARLDHRSTTQFAPGS